MSDLKRGEPTREEWLLQAVEMFRPWFKEHGHPLPKKIRVSVGFPLGNRKAIGQCFSADSSEDNTHAVFISPKLKDATQVLGTLLHECVHTVFPYGTGHKAPFQKLAGALGLEAPWTATTESEALKRDLRRIAARIGKYPHAVLSPVEIKKQTTRLLLVQCVPCKIKYRMSAQAIEDVLEARGECVCMKCREPAELPEGMGEEDGEE